MAVLRGLGPQKGDLTLWPHAVPQALEVLNSPWSPTKTQPPTAQSTPTDALIALQSLLFPSFLVNPLQVSKGVIFFHF